MNSFRQRKQGESPPRYLEKICFQLLIAYLNSKEKWFVHLKDFLHRTKWSNSEYLPKEHKLEVSRVKLNQKEKWLSEESKTYCRQSSLATVESQPWFSVKRYTNSQNFGQDSVLLEMFRQLFTDVLNYTLELPLNHTVIICGNYLSKNSWSPRHKIWMIPINGPTTVPRFTVFFYFFI